jgi:hypothetical protein
LPYCTDGTAVDAPVRVLLVTSREIKRWVSLDDAADMVEEAAV